MKRVSKWLWLWSHLGKLERLIEVTFSTGNFFQRLVYNYLHPELPVEEVESNIPIVIDDVVK